MFADNAHAGRFVRALCTDITRRIRQLEDAEMHEAMKAAQNAMSLTTEEGQAVHDSAILAVPVDIEATHRHRRLLRGLLVHERDPAATVAADVSKTCAYDAFSPSTVAVMVDQSVYTRNRSFRLFLSSKNTPPFIVSSQNYCAENDVSSSNSNSQLESPPVLLVAATEPLSAARRRAEGHFSCHVDLQRRVRSRSTEAADLQRA